MIQPRSRQRIRIFGWIALGVIAGVPACGELEAQVLSEILISHQGTDDTEFIELTGKPKASLQGLSLLVVDSRAEEAGIIRRRFDLKPFHRLGDNGKFLLGNAEGLQRRFHVSPDVHVAQDYLPNYPLTVALVTTSSLLPSPSTDFSDLAAGNDSGGHSGDDSRQGQVGQRIRGDESVLDAVAFGQTGQASQYFYDAPVMIPESDHFPAGAERQPSRLSGRAEDSWQLIAFRFQLAKPLHSPTPSEDARERPLAIYEIQADGFRSPYEGEYRKTVGIVTAVGHQGFYLQDAEGDQDPSTSDGIFVFGGRDYSPPEVGDRLVLSAWVEEFIPGGRESQNLSITQLKSPVIHETVKRQPIPAAVLIGEAGRMPPATEMFRSLKTSMDLNSNQALEIELQPERYGLDFFESLEGMLVQVKQPQCISPTRVFGKYNSEVFVVADQGRGVSPKDALTRRGVLKLQPHAENRGDQNPERIQIQFDASPSVRGTLYPSTSPVLNVGDQLESVTGVVGYSFGNFEIHATQTVTVRSGEMEQEVTSLVGDTDQLTLASYNVLNLSADADDDGQRKLVARQVVRHLRSPDIIAFQEIQDDSGERDDGETKAEQTLHKLVVAIEEAGGPRYQFLNVPPVDGKDGGVPGGNIRNAFLYNAERVKLIQYAALTPRRLRMLGVSDPLAFEGARTPLLATFGFLGHELTLVNNHLSSRYGSSPVAGAIQPFVQGGRRARVRQARCLNEWSQLMLHQDPESYFAVLGDMNTFEFDRELIQELTRRQPLVGKDMKREPALLNLIDKAEPDDRYTYIFEGNAQALDHCFVSPRLYRPAEFDIVHVNTGFHRGVELASSGKVASDHEPILARFRFPPQR